MENPQLWRFLLIKQRQILLDHTFILKRKGKLTSMHPYMGKKAVLPTIHGKQRAIVQPFKTFLNVSIKAPNKINTDLLGTFSGKIER